ncbi:MAG: ABC transporter ATP-binding protein [Clostridiales bacterium]|nr:ABC transporter ATP-binding protein [Clostridiales bacterium]
MKKASNNISIFYQGLAEIHKIRSGLLSLIIAGSVFNALSPFINIYMSGLIINGIANKQPFEHLLFLVLLTVSINLIIGMIASVFRHLIAIHKQEFNARYQMQQSSKISRMDYVVAESPETYRLRQKIIDHANANNAGIIGLPSSIQNLIEAFFTILFSISLTVSLFFTPVSTENWLNTIITSPLTSIFVLLMICISVIVSMHANAVMTKKLYVILGEATQFNKIYNYYIENYLCNYNQGKDIRIYNQKDLIKSECSGLLDTVMNRMIKKLTRNQINSSVTATIAANFLDCIIYLYIGIKALLGLIHVGGIIQYIGSITQFSAGFTKFLTQLALIKANNEALKLYFEFMHLPETIEKGTQTIKTHNHDEFEIEFINVSFQYPGTDTYALKNINLKLKSGKRFAVVGMNGSGKTTLIKLLCRLYEPTAGKITLNGIDIQEYKLDEYIALFGVVFQDFKLFSFSLAQNIAANNEIDQNFAELCLERSGFSERMHTMPQRLDTSIHKDFDEDGIEISGGEAQKIALARALYKNAPFIVLDEPTAALDPIAEYEIFNHFNQIIENKTAVYISHRLSSCRFCSDIIVLHDGELIQYGSHDTLLADTNGKYFELWHAQAQYYCD